MKAPVACLLSLMLAASAHAQDATESRTWAWRGGIDAGAWLKTERRGNRVRFELELNRGAPSHNSGQASGEFTIRHHLGIYQSDEYPDCVLAFAFVGDTVEIRQSGASADCGFGFSVMADHLLTLEPQQAEP
jgi:hypothetical protein